MNKIKKIIIFICISSLMFSTNIIKAEDGIDFGFGVGNLPEEWVDNHGHTYYWLWDDKVTIIKTVPPKSTNETLMIPDTIVHGGKTYKVTSVGDPYWLEKEPKDHIVGKGYKKIIYGRNINNIYRNAHINIPSIEELTFTGENIVIGEKAFAFCKNLKKIQGIENIDRIHNFAFGGTGFITLNLSKLKSIGSSAFANCNNLRELVVSNVSTIEDYAFNECKNLKKVTIKNGVKYFGECAFGSCSKLKKVTLPKTLKWMDNGVFAFSNNPKLKITIPKKNKNYYVKDNCIISKKNKHLISVFGSPKVIVIPSFVVKVRREALCFNRSEKKIKAIIMKGKKTKFEKRAYPDKKIPCYYPKGGKKIKGIGAPIKQYEYSSIKIIKGKKVKYNK